MLLDWKWKFHPHIANEFQVGDGWGIMMIRLEGTLVKS